MYVVRGAFGNPALLPHGFRETLDHYTVTLSIRSVRARGSKLHYRTLQMTDDLCTCTYVYEGNVKNPLTKMSACSAVSDFTQSFYRMVDAAPEHHFHQIVGNCYDNALSQAIPWHSDQSDLLSHTTDVVSVSLGCGGVFCYMPNERQAKSDFHMSLSLRKTWSARRQVATERRLRGCVPLFAGDVLLMCGTFQNCMQHITLPFRPKMGARAPKLYACKI